MLGRVITLLWIYSWVFDSIRFVDPVSIAIDAKGSRTLKDRCFNRFFNFGFIDAGKFYKRDFYAVLTVLTA